MGEESSAKQSQQLVALKLEDGVGEESSAEQSQQLVALKLVSSRFQSAITVGLGTEATSAYVCCYYGRKHVYRH